MCDIPYALKTCKLYSWRHKVCKTQPRFQGLSYLPLLVVGRKTLLAIMVSERNNWRSGKFFVYTGGPVFIELQNTTYTEGTILLIFPKDEVRRAHCLRLVRIHQPNCKATNASVLCSLRVVALHEPSASPTRPRVTSQPRVNHESSQCFFYFLFCPQKKK